MIQSAPNLSDFDYELPKKMIAQSPAEPRDSSRLLVMSHIDYETSRSNAKHGLDYTLEHRLFPDILSYIKKGDVLVINDTKVSAMRLEGKKISGGKVRVLVLSISGESAICLMQGKSIREGTIVEFLNGEVVARVKRQRPDGKYEIEFENSAEGLEERLRNASDTPLPPYIHNRLDRPGRYQTVYAREYGSAAAPTAGLHFTDHILKTIQEMGVAIVHVTLHIGTGTFLPVRDESLKTGKLEEERYEITSTAANQINDALVMGGRLIVAGTSTLRCLESAAGNGRVTPQTSTTDLFIFPGYKFRLPVHALLTNFHLPRSTLIMLVCAYAGRNNIMAAYRDAIAKEYRFYSFGDAMLVINGNSGTVDKGGPVYV